MAIGTNKSDSTMEQLYSKLLKINKAKHPEQYEALIAEVVRRVLAGETLPAQPDQCEGENDYPYFVVNILSILQYGALLLFIAWWQISDYLSTHESEPHDRWLLFYFSTLILFLLPMAYRGMQWLLKSATDQMAVKMWAQVALLLAPYTAFLNFLLGAIVLMYCPMPSHLLKYFQEHWFWHYLLLFFVGFYMPFVLITLWLRYKWREDEF
jgi:hypothetical protein